MAANDGPVPVRALAYAARLVHEARHLPRYGITVGEFALQYDELLARVGEVVRDGVEATLAHLGEMIGARRAACMGRTAYLRDPQGLT